MEHQNLDTTIEVHSPLQRFCGSKFTFCFLKTKKELVDYRYLFRNKHLLYSMQSCKRADKYDTEPGSNP